MKNLAVCIPSIGSPYLEKLWRGIVESEPSVSIIEVMINKDVGDLGVVCSPLEESPPHVHPVHRHGMSIYQIWNDFRRRYEYYNGYLAFLNDDIEILPGTLGLMVRALEEAPSEVAIVYPDARYSNLTELPKEINLTYTETTGGDGGMTGYCYMMRTGLFIPYIDENLTLYWGDDDLVKQTLAKGYKIAQIDKLPIIHAGSYTIRKMDQGEWNTTMEKDRAYFNQKYRENRSPVIV